MRQPHADLAQLFNDAMSAFRKQFDAEPTIAATAPGRVNLIGEHTDYNDGFVMPLALDKRTVMVGRPNGNQITRILETNEDEQLATFPIDSDLSIGSQPWANYIKGVLAQFIANGHYIPNFDAVVSTNVPIGGGLSSSAALEVTTATFCEQLEGIQLEPVNKALWCQKAEHDFAGMPCGIMDQFISVLGQKGHALLIDCRSHQTRQVKLDDPTLSIVITNSNVKHKLSGSEYPTRRRQCEEAAAMFDQLITDRKVKALRDVQVNEIQLIQNKVEPVIFNRARHVITENDRTCRAADALDQRDYFEAGALMCESHRSLKDDFQVSCPELDALVDLAMQVDGVFGSRMTGGGFGGCTVALVKTDAVDALIAHLKKQYPEKTGKTPTCFATTASDGAMAIDLSNHSGLT